MTKFFACAFALVGAIALMTPAPATAQATQALVTEDGLCFGVGEHTRVVTRPCDKRFNVGQEATGAGTILVAHLSDGTTQCLDGYQGKGNSVEAVACDGTREQLWYVHGQGWLQNVATGLCMDIRDGSRLRGARIINWDCNHAWNQTFSFQDRGAFGGAIAATTPTPAAAPAPVSGSFGSPASGGGEVLSHNGATLVGNDGSSLIGNGSGTVLPTGASGNVVSTSSGGLTSGGSADGYGGIVAAGAGNLIGQDGSSLVAAGAGNLRGYGLQSTGGCRDPWVTQTITEVVGRAPSESGEDGNCNIRNYNNGSWGSYEELRGYVIQRLGYRLQVGHLCLDGSGSVVVVRDCGSATRFQLTNGMLRTAANRCIDGWRGRTKRNAPEDGNVREPVETQPCNETDPEQKWTTYQLSNEQFFLLNQQHPLCMDVEYGQLTPGQTVLLWKCYDSVRPANQIFTIYE